MSELLTLPQNKKTSPGYLVRSIQDSPTVPCPCGESTRILTKADGAPCSFHITAIRDSIRHYHRLSAEVYYILEGTGTLELNDDLVSIEPGMMIYIEPLTRHRLVSPGGVRTMVVAIPPFQVDDEYFDAPTAE